MNQPPRKPPAEAVDQALQPNTQDEGVATISIRPLPEAAQRALAEAEQRRQMAAETSQPAATEVGGRGGLDPVRYGDWETGGLASDF